MNTEKIVSAAKAAGRGIDTAFRFVAQKYADHPKTSLGVTLAVFLFTHWLR